MKILSIIKGFVTNSSSANYWLDEEVVSGKSEDSLGAPVDNIPKEARPAGGIESFFIWGLFSIILIIVFLNKKIKKAKNNLVLWLKTFEFSLLIFIFGNLYILAQTEGYYSLYLVNKIFALNAIILIGLSYTLSKLAHFWKFFKNKLIYRKYLGLTGFGFVLLHTITSFFFIPQRFVWPDFFLENPIEIIFSTLALLIFTLMAIISTRYIINKLKEKNRRFLLRLGFIGYIFAVLHFALLKYDIWFSWFQTRDIFLPPFSFTTFIFAFGFIVIHLAYYISLIKSKKKK